jgi:hypothetical protein
MVAGLPTNFVEFLDQAVMPVTKDLDNRDSYQSRNVLN